MNHRVSVWKEPKAQDSIGPAANELERQSPDRWCRVLAQGRIESSIGVPVTDEIKSLLASRYRLILSDITEMFAGARKGLAGKWGEKPPRTRRCER